MSEPKTATLPQESEAWNEAYRDPQLVARRLRKHRQRLAEMEIFSWPRDLKILDLCCGSGEALRILREEGFMDLSGSDVTIDNELRKEPWVKLEAADSRKLPYGDATFDAVICMHSLHHLGGLDGIRAALTEAARVLKPGGRLALIDHFDSWQLRLAFWAVSKRWLTWPTSGLRSFRKQHEDEWPYMMEYLDNWPKVRAIIDGLGFSPVDVDGKERYFFYWVGRKR